MRIALYRDGYSTHTAIRDVQSEKYMTGDIRVSEIVEIEFKMIKAACDIADAAMMKRDEAKGIIANYRKALEATV
jgi:hypothetical protein